VELLQALWDADRLPVLSCLALAGDASILNVNADSVASRLSIELAADVMVAVTGVGGVRTVANDPSTRIARLNIKDAHVAIARGHISGGMIAKVEEACTALGAGVHAVHIVGPNEIAASLSAPGSVGTVLLPEG
jgi:acetylglutamate kinase